MDRDTVIAECIAREASSHGGGRFGWKGWLIVLNVLNQIPGQHANPRPSLEGSTIGEYVIKDAECYCVSCVWVDGPPGGRVLAEKLLEAVLVWIQRRILSETIKEN